MTEKPLEAPWGDSLPPDALLAPKLFIPQVHSDVLDRPRLTHRLSSGLKRKLTLISAPPLVSARQLCLVRGQAKVGCPWHGWHSTKATTTRCAS